MYITNILKSIFKCNSVFKIQELKSKTCKIFLKIMSIPTHLGKVPSISILSSFYTRMKVHAFWKEMDLDSILAVLGSPKGTQAMQTWNTASSHDLPQLKSEGSICQDYALLSEQVWQTEQLKPQCLSLPEIINCKS